MFRSFLVTTAVVLAIISSAVPALTAEGRQDEPSAGQSDDRREPSPLLTLGLGGRAGSVTVGVGGSVRYWSHRRFGFQIDVTRASVGIDSLGTSVGSSTTQISPAVLYAFPMDYDSSKSTFLQPYVGSGVNIIRSSLSTETSLPEIQLSDETSSSRVGFHAFGGVQVIFNRLPKLGISCDLTYHTTSEPFAGVETGGFGLAIAGHWFVR